MSTTGDPIAESENTIALLEGATLKTVIEKRLKKELASVCAHARQLEKDAEVHRISYDAAGGLLKTATQRIAELEKERDESVAKSVADALRKEIGELRDDRFAVEHQCYQMNLWLQDIHGELGADNEPDTEKDLVDDILKRIETLQTDRDSLQARLDGAVKYHCIYPKEGTEPVLFNDKEAADEWAVNSDGTLETVCEVLILPAPAAEVKG